MLRRKNAKFFPLKSGIVSSPFFSHSPSENCWKNYVWGHIVASHCVEKLPFFVICVAHQNCVQCRPMAGAGEMAVMFVGWGIKMIPPTTGVKRIKRDTGLGGGRGGIVREARRSAILGQNAAFCGGEALLRKTT